MITIINYLFILFKLYYPFYSDPILSPTNKKNPHGDSINIKVGVGGQVASKVRLDTVEQKFSTQGFTDHVIPPAVTYTRQPLNNKEVTSSPRIPINFPPTTTLNQHDNDVYDGS